MRLVDDPGLTLYHGDCRAILPTLAADSVHCVVTSPPYWGLRDYGIDGQLGLEPTPEAYVASMVAVFRAVRRVLRADGTLWLNMGDAYCSAPPGNAGACEGISSAASERGAQATERRAWRRGSGLPLKPKDLVGMPWRLAFALQADGWYLRSDIIWAKPNPMPESVTDRPTKAHEYVFLFAKSARYFYDADAVREPCSPLTNDRGRGTSPKNEREAAETGRHNGFGAATAGRVDQRNMRSVWTIPSAPFPDAHFATFPPALASRCIQAGSSEKGCCRACGAPWARVLERATPPKQLHDKITTMLTGDGVNDMRYHNVGGQRYQNWLDANPPQTVGWHPTCVCTAPPIPCTVLDPFAGSGTTGQVAEQLGRHALLIELAAPYVQMATDRTRQRGLFSHPPLPHDAPCQTYPQG
jgi:DNA modification methylase